MVCDPEVDQWPLVLSTLGCLSPIASDAYSGKPVTYSPSPRAPAPPTIDAADFDLGGKCRYSAKGWLAVKRALDIVSGCPMPIADYLHVLLAHGG
jgi:hypothetical protein